MGSVVEKSEGGIHESSSIRSDQMLKLQIRYPRSRRPVDIKYTPFQNLCLLLRRSPHQHIASSLLIPFTCPTPAPTIKILDGQGEEEETYLLPGLLFHLRLSYIPIRRLSTRPSSAIALLMPCRAGYKVIGPTLPKQPSALLVPTTK